MSEGLDIIIFVLRQDKIDLEDLAIFRFVYEYIFEKAIADNLLLYISGTETAIEWVNQTHQSTTISAKILQEIVDCCRLGIIGHDFPEEKINHCTGELVDPEMEQLNIRRRGERADTICNTAKQQLG